MDAAARVTSKGQVTVPKAVRDALGIREGDEVVFHVEGNRAVLTRTPDFLALAGSGWALLVVTATWFFGQRESVDARS